MFSPRYQVNLPIITANTVGIKKQDVRTIVQISMKMMRVVKIKNLQEESAERL